MGNPAENRSSAQNSEISEQPVAPAKPPFENMVWIPGGTFMMGSDKHYPEEAPAHEVTVDGFWMDTHTVTNEEFRKFVEATKHVTSAERAPNPDDYPGAKPELLVPASVVFQKPKQRVNLTIVTNGGPMFRAPTGVIPKVRRVPSRAERNIRSYSLRMKTWKLTRNGLARNCPPKPNGNLPRAADWPELNLSGAMNLLPQANTWRTVGRESSPGKISRPTDSKALRQWAVFHRTATASTTWRATFGSGRQIGIRSMARSRIPAAAISIRGVRSKIRVTIPIHRTLKSHAR